MPSVSQQAVQSSIQSRDANPQHRRRPRHIDVPERVCFVALLVLLVALFLGGGGAREDIRSLLYVRPLAILCLGVALWRLTVADLRRFRVVFAMLAAAMALALLQLVPLPPGVWSSIGGRAFLSDVAAAAGQSDVWRPISIAPTHTLNAFFALSVTLAVAALSASLNDAYRARLVYVFLAFGLISGLVGMLQAVGLGGTSLYFYRVTNPDSAVGLFANRNHQAALIACMFPVLAVFATTGANSPEQARIRVWIALAAGATLIPLLLVTGSRSGVVLGLLGLGTTLLLRSEQRFSHAPRRKVHRYDPKTIAIMISAFGIAALTTLLSRARAVERFGEAESLGDLRLEVIRPIAAAARDMLPFGSGLGTFVEAYQMVEPDQLLERSYLNHAHNDVLEVFLIGGIPGVALMLAGIAAWIIATWRLFGRDRPRDERSALGRLGAVITGLLALASVVDYPLRTPTLAALFVVAALWMAAALTPDSQKKTMVQ